MPEFTAAIFATKERPFGQEHSYVAHAFLFEGSRPYWEIYINEKRFRFIPNPEFILEDVLWQLSMYCQIPEEEYKHDVHKNIPSILEEEFVEEHCNQMRSKLSEELLTTQLHYKIVQWPGFWINKWNNKVEALKEKGVAISLHQ